MSNHSQHMPRLLITAGPTHEPIDDVRYIGNRSSGALGVALAQHAARLGARTTLLLGPIGAGPPDTDASLHRFRTAAELRTLLAHHAHHADILIMAAAVADYRPAHAQPGKLRRTDRALTLELEPVPDLVAEVAARHDDTGAGPALILAFALEPADDLLHAAQRKLERKHVDAVVANPLETMEAPDISAVLLWRDGRAEHAPPRTPKADFAPWLLERLIERWRAHAGGPSPQSTAPTDA